MTFTVEKIGGTSMTAFDAVLDNIILRPKTPYNRIFVVSAYGGMTDALLECKKTSKPGVYQLIAKRDDKWEEALAYVESRMLLTNENIFADPMNRIRADKFIRSRIAEAKNCIANILETCQYGQFSLRQYLPQIREFLSSIGEAHSAYNTALKLKIWVLTLSSLTCLVGIIKRQEALMSRLVTRLLISMYQKNCQS